MGISGINRIKIVSQNLALSYAASPQRVNCPWGRLIPSRKAGAGGILLELAEWLQFSPGGTNALHATIETASLQLAASGSAGALLAAAYRERVAAAGRPAVSSLNRSASTTPTA